MVGLEGDGVGSFEGVGELFLLVLDVGIESEGDKLEATVNKFGQRMYQPREGRLS